MPQLIYLGSSDFIDMRTRAAYYVDKTRLIGEVLRSSAKIMLIPRPRRFGKTLNLSMLRCFFGQNDATLFSGLDVNKDAATMAQLGAFPTVFLTFKDVRCANWQESFGMIRLLFGRLFLEHREVWQKAQPVGFELEATRAILGGNAEAHIYQNALLLLTDLLKRATGKNVMLLIDEYDSPIHEGHLCGYKDEVVHFMSQCLGAALKDNPHLERAVITGILPVAKDSIFSGLNNLGVFSILEEPFSDCFGFTEEEVHQLLETRGLLEREQAVKHWYNGYVFGKQVIYNPWSILSMASESKRALGVQWINTSSNALIRDLVTKHKTISVGDLEALFQDQTFIRDIQPGTALNELTPESVWSLLLFSGYLTIRSQVGPDRYDLRIPNYEVRVFFEQTVRAWMGERVIQSLSPLLASLLDEDLELFTARLTALMRDSLSYYDSAGPEHERIYHVFLLGVLSSLNDRYQVLSNQEAGHGRYDLALIPRDPSQAGFIFELKRAEEKDLPRAARAAYAQIEQREYGAALRRQGVSRIISLGLAFCGKRVAVASSLGEHPMAVREREAVVAPPLAPDEGHPQIFVSYVLEDQVWMDLLRKPLKASHRRIPVTIWDGSGALVEGRFSGDMDQAIAAARVALLLVSIDFLASDFIVEHELPLLLKRCAAGELTVIPIPVGPADWHIDELSSIQAAWDPELPLAVMTAQERDKALVALAKKIASELRA